MPRTYPPELEEPKIEHIKVRVGDATIGVAFTGMRKSPASGYVSHYEIIIKRKGGEYWYKISGLWDPFGKARVTSTDIVEGFWKFLKRVEYVNHSRCPVCRSLKLSGEAIYRLMYHVENGEYTRL